MKGKEPDGEMFDARIKMLVEYTAHHIKDEQDQMFPKAKTISLDMKASGAQMTARKAELLADRSRPS